MEVGAERRQKAGGDDVSLHRWIDGDQRSEERE
jgi:hypothetical protein